MKTDLLRQVDRSCAPPGAGWASSSTGVAPLAHSLHDWRFGSSDLREVRSRWLEEMESVPAAAAVLGVPYDAGTYGLGGASGGPLGIRLAYGAWPSGVVDLGDVRYLPGVPTDDLMSLAALEAVRLARFGSRFIDDPVCMLSVVALLSQLAVGAGLPLLLLGGDHSVSATALAGHREKRLALVHFDAHADLSRGRDGFALLHSSWVHVADTAHSFAVVIQVGVPEEDAIPAWIGNRLHRTSLTSLRQDANSLAALLARLEDSNVDGVYISVDIDVIDANEAPATGLPAQNGATTAEILGVIDAVASRFEVVGADIAEVAPPLGSEPDWSQEITCQTAARVARALLAALGCP